MKIKRKEYRKESRKIYEKPSDGTVLSPFSLNIDYMEHLILVNFEKDRDVYYNTFELQKACDKDGRKSYLVIAYRNDGTSDVYHQQGFPLASQKSILNNASFIVNSLENAKFDINTDRLDVFFAFEDKMSRQIKVKVTENRRQEKTPFSCLPL